MDERTTTSARSARPGGNANGCLLIVGVLVALVVIGVAWNAITGKSDSHRKHVDRASFGPAWPLTVDSADIGCQAGHDIYAQLGSIRYALNDTTKADGGYEDVDAIWTADPSSPGLKMDISGLRNQAQALC
jgi:hypothetical protein